VVITLKNYLKTTIHGTVSRLYQQAPGKVYNRHKTIRKINPAAFTQGDFNEFRLESNQAIEREFSPLLAVGGQYPKYVITMDDFWKDTIEGVRHLYIADFLLSDSL